MMKGIEPKAFLILSTGHRLVDNELPKIQHNISLINVQR